MKEEIKDPIALNLESNKSASQRDGDSPAPDLHNPEVLKNLRLEQSDLDLPLVKPVLVNIPLRKPRPLEFFRVHPGEDYRFGPILMTQPLGSREFFVVSSELRTHLRPREYWIAEIVLAINTQAEVFLWPLKLRSPLGRISDWSISALECVERAQTDWVQMEADMSQGMYRVVLAEDRLGDPEWPEQSFKELLEMGLKHRRIDSLDHEVIKQLRGRL
jgi:hypothetical protein